MFFQVLDGFCFYFVPVSVEGDAEIGGRLGDSGHGAHDAEDLAPEVAEGVSEVERVVDENRRFRHHDEVGDRQIHHEHVGRRTERLFPEIIRALLIYRWKSHF